MRLIVKCMDLYEFEIETNPSMTIGELKQEISKVLLVDKSKQYLILKGNILPDCITIGRLGLNDMDNIWLYAKELRERFKKYPAMKAKEKLDDLLQHHVMNGIGNLMDSLKSRNPNWSQVLNDEDTILQNWNALKDPATRRELMRVNDRTMNLTELKPTGMKELIKHHDTVSMVSEQILTNYKREPTPHATVIPKAPSAPCSDPLPTPYADVTGIQEALIKMLFHSRVFGDEEEEMPEKPKKREENKEIIFPQIFFSSKTTNRGTTVIRFAPKRKKEPKAEPSFWDSSSDDEESQPVMFSSRKLESTSSSDTSDIENDCDID